MRALIFLFGFILFASMVYDIYSTIASSSKEVEIMGKNGYLIGALIPPPGEEETYKLILAGVNPYDPNAKKLIERGKAKKTENVSVSSNGRLLAKTKSYFIKDDSLYVTEIVYNPKKEAFNGSITVVCTLKDEEKKPVDMVFRKARISIPPKKAVKLENVDLGKVSMLAGNVKFVSCKVRTD